jgi:hypothetical protein
MSAELQEVLRGEEIRRVCGETVRTDWDGPHQYTFDRHIWTANQCNRTLKSSAAMGYPDNSGGSRIGLEGRGSARGVRDVGGWGRTQ